MRERWKAAEGRKRGRFAYRFFYYFFFFFLFLFLEPSLLLCGQLRIDERACWMMELFGLGGGCSPRLWL